MTTLVRFSQSAADELLRFAVIVARMDGQWLFCRHQARDTYECPGGHREPNETIEQTARRELYEETGATDYTLAPVCVYSVTKNGVETFGMLYRAEVRALGELPADFEMAEVRRFDALPSSWTYPEIQPLLLRRAWNSTE